MSGVKIRKIGNSLGVLLPKEIQEVLEVGEGDLIEFTKLGEKKVIIENVLPHHSEWNFDKATELNAEDSEWLEADLEDDHVPSW